MWALLGQPETPSSQGTLVTGMAPFMKGDDPFSLTENLPGMRLLLAHSAVLLFGKRPSFSLFPCHTLHRTCCASEEFREGIWGLVVFFCTHPFPKTHRNSITSQKSHSALRFLLPGVSGNNPMLLLPVLSGRRTVGRWAGWSEEGPAPVCCSNVENGGKGLL